MKNHEKYDYLLMFRWILINLVGCICLGVAYLNGWVGMVLAADPTYISVVIFVIFLWGVLISGVRTYSTSREINYAKKGSKKSKWRYIMTAIESQQDDPAKIIEAMRMKMFARISAVKWFANSLVLMGLIGTVVGFIIALSGVDPALVSDVTAIGRMVSFLISGMGTALYTTLVGGVLNLWLSANYQILAEGSANLLATLLEMKEDAQ
jgi:hypothetical protein